MKRIGLFTSGGDAPGMNACIRAVVRSAIYYDFEIYGIYRGYQGMIDNKIVQMHSHSVSNILQRGGTILKSSRCDDFKTPEGRKIAYENLKSHGIEALIAIGGDGTFTGAEIFSREYGIPTIGIPGTIDNDIFGTDFTIGFDTAVNTVLDAIDKIRDTADSHGRIFFVEVMGRDSGYIAIRTAIGGGAEGVMIPENNVTEDDIVEYLKDDIRRDKTFSIIVVAEKDKPGNSLQIAEKCRAEVEGKDIRVTILGHIQRGGAPSAQDRVLASRLGHAAVEGLKNGMKDVMAGVTNNQVSYVSLKESVGKKKPLIQDLLKLVKILSI